MITGVDFIGLPTRDLDAAVAFYGDTLGLHRSVYRPDRHHAEFETGNLTINTMASEKMGLPFVLSQNPIALHVDDVAAGPLRAGVARSGVPGGHVRHRRLSHGVLRRTRTGTRSCCITATRHPPPLPERRHQLVRRVLADVMPGALEQHRAVVEEDLLPALALALAERLVARRSRRSARGGRRATRGRSPPRRARAWRR